MRTVVITGVSTGIGAATARVMAGRGFHVFGSVRREVDARALREGLGDRFTPLIFDVTDRAAVDAAAAEVGRALGGATLSGLVNNAGIAVAGPLLYLSADDFRRQLEVNLVGQLHVTQAFAPLLGAVTPRVSEPGRIVMMSSVGGRNGSPFIGPYNTSKFGLEGLSESLRRELLLFGIDVVVVAPGPIATPIWDKAEALDPALYAQTPYVPAIQIARQVIARGRHGLPAERVGEVVHTALTTSRPKVRYTVTPDRIGTWLAEVLPRRLVDRIVAKRLGWR